MRDVARAARATEFEWQHPLLRENLLDRPLQHGGPPIQRTSPEAEESVGAMTLVCLGMASRRST